MYQDRKSAAANDRQDEDETLPMVYMRKADVLADWQGRRPFSTDKELQAVAGHIHSLNSKGNK
jgi:hypothetical protein